MAEPARKPHPPPSVVVWVCKCGRLSTARSDLAFCYGPSQRYPERHDVKPYSYIYPAEEPDV